MSSVTIASIRQPRGQAVACGLLLIAYLAFPVAMALGNVAMAGAFIAGIYCWRKLPDRYQLWISPVCIAAWALYVVMLVGIAYSNASWSDITLHLTKYSKLLMLPVFFVLMLNSAWRMRCMQAFMWAMGFITLSAFANVWWQLPWSATQNLGWGQDHTVIGDYITQNIMVTFFVILLLERAVAAAHMAHKLMWSLGALLAMTVVTQLSQGRTGYVLLLAALLAYGALWARGLKQWLAMGCLVVAAALSLAASDTVRARVEIAVVEAQNSGAMEITSIGGRINFWKNTWAMIEQRPLLGWGTGSYHDQWCEQVQRADWCGFGRWHPHNQYLFFWVEQGLPGLLLFIGLLAAPLWAARTASPGHRRMLVCFVVIFALNSLINAPLWSSRESHFFVLMLALLCAGPVFAKPQGAASAC